MNTLVSAAELAALIGDSRTIVADCRFSLADESAGFAAWRQDHIPGARYVNLNNDLSAPVAPGKTGRHPLPRRELFAETLGRLGIGNDARVVAYDDASGAFAARLWWMLRWAGHEEVFVLDGGYKAWCDGGNPVSAEIPTFEAREFALKAPLTRTASANDLPDRDCLLLDARDAARYRGESETIDPVAGHIPGAVSAPFTENLTASQQMKSPAELQARFRSLGVVDGAACTCYCGSGVTAAHDILAMVHAGYAEPALFPGSWSEWITDPARPVETGTGSAPP